ncbi:MAG: hypothetical protein HON94_12145 [Methylococcales bacterium]|nr:hypothetical protein [Methylococcales bacterium]MBT7410946.1 hypothetical protein [Methylococcales bacterium]
MINLSEILALAETEINDTYYQVTVDEESYSPPNNLKCIGVIAQFDDGELALNVLDLIIAYTLSDIEVILEIPAEIDDFDEKYLVSIAANADFSLSLWAPKNTDKEAKNKYFKRLKAFTQAYFQQSNLSKFIYPISSFLEYLAMECIDANSVKNYKPASPYIINTFDSPISKEFADELKAVIREEVYQIFNGEEAYCNFTKTLAHGIYKQAENNLQDLVTDTQPPISE